MMDKHYKQYLANHNHPKIRLMHFIGQLATLFYITYVLYIKEFWFLIFAPLIVYPFAVSSHYIFGSKGNKPSFHQMGYLQAKRCDIIMFIDILKGKLKIW